VFAANAALICHTLTSYDGATSNRSSAGSSGFSPSRSHHSVLAAGVSVCSHDDSVNTGVASDASSRDGSRGKVVVEVEVELEGQKNHG